MITIAAITFFLKRAFYFIVDHWKIFAIVLVLIVGGLWFRSCFTKTPKLDEKAQEEAKQAIAKNDRAAMEKVLVESEVKEKQIDANLQDANAQKVNAIAEAKKKVQALSDAELAAELERRLNQ